MTNEVLFYGLWQFPETVDRQLESMRTVEEKNNALKAQLNFRKTVLGQKVEDKKVFQFSEKGKQYSVIQLCTNVKKLIKSALENRTTGIQENPDNVFVGKKVIHYLEENNVRKPYRGCVISYVPGFPQWFKIVYQNEQGVFVYKLQEHYAAGDLEIVV